MAYNHEHLTQQEELDMVSQCMNCANPPLSLISWVCALCSLTNLFIPNCAPLLRKWLVAVQCDNVANARMGANNDTDPDSRALQPIYTWKLFTLLCPKGIFDASLLLSGRKPTTSELCLIEALATEPDIGDARNMLACAYLCADGTFGAVGSEGAEAESVSKLVPLFQKSASNEDIAIALNELLIMYIKKGIMIDELCEYAKILDPENQYTKTIIALLLGLHSGASLSTFGTICDNMIGHITARATTKGAFGTTTTPTQTNIIGMILTVYIGTVLTQTTATTTPTPTTVTDKKQPITTECVIILAIDCGYNDIVTVMKVAHDRAVRADAELFWHVLTSHMRNIEQIVHNHH